jgi:hypothetical protein
MPSGVEIPEARWQFVIDAVKAAIGKNSHHVARRNLGRDAVYDCVRIGQQFRGCSRSASGMRCC